jgi:hypothetical protein
VSEGDAASQRKRERRGRTADLRVRHDISPEMSKNQATLDADGAASMPCIEPLRDDRSLRTKMTKLSSCDVAFPLYTATP